LQVLVIDNLIDRADKIILCGGMAYTFMKTIYGMPIGKSLFDQKGAELAPTLMEKAKAKGVEIVLPVDWACGQDFCNDQEIKMVTKEEGIPDGWEGMDCGPASMELFKQVVLNSKTVIWNGPAGVFEFDNFAKVRGQEAPPFSRQMACGMPDTLRIRSRLTFTRTARTAALLHCSFAFCCCIFPCNRARTRC
jgi:phosphoglycerate kinase